MCGSTSPEEILVRAAGTRLEGRLAGPPLVLDEQVAEAALRAARFDRLSGFLVDAVAQGDIRVASSELSTTLQEQHRQELRVCIALETLLRDVSARLDEAGIAWRATKGVALAHLDYPDPSIRTFGDIDIVVLPQHWDALVPVLAEAGLTRESSPLPGGYDKRFGKGATFRSLSRLELDVHVRFAIGRFGVTSRTDQLFGSMDTFALGGLTIWALDGPGRLLHACYHASLGGYRRLRAFRDVAQLLLVSDGAWERTFELARSWRGEPVVSSAILDTWDRLRLSSHHPALDRARSTSINAAERRALMRFTARSSFRAQALTALPVLPGRQVPRYLWSLTSPTVHEWLRKVRR